MKKSQLWPLPVLLLCFFLALTQAAGHPDAEYVGSETCLECHDTIYRTLKKTPHINLNLTKDTYQIDYCESCHGPGSDHIDDPEVKSSIRSYKQSTSEESTSVCLSCHQKSSHFRRFRGEKHYQTGESCTTCHSVHQTNPRDSLISIQPEKLCFNCHQEKEAAFNLPYHHKVKEGRMTCWSCHDPHNVEVSSQGIGRKKIYERCFDCHPAQKGPFTHEHPSARVGGCSVCHKPHGSENARLLQRSNQYLLCIECHSGPLTSSLLFGTKTTSFHITSKAAYQSCTVCHVRIHGSYLNKHFLR